MRAARAIVSKPDSAHSIAQLRERLAGAEVVPAHWLQFGSRHSPITGGPRIAINPPNVRLKYCFALAESECRLELVNVLRSEDRLRLSRYRQQRFLGVGLT